MMTSETETRRQQLHKYLNDTYGLLAQAEHKVVLSTSREERTNLRTKINEYEAYLEKWQEELSLLNLENGTTGTEKADLVPEFGSPAAEAYLFGLARKSYALGSYPEALNLVQAIRQRDPVYPGLESLEHNILAVSDLSSPHITLRADDGSASIQPKSNATNNFRFQLITAILALLVVVGLILFLLVNQPGQSRTSRGNSPAVAPTVTRIVVVPPAATYEPFLVATPTVIPNVPTAPPAPPQPTPTKR